MEVATSDSSNPQQQAADQAQAGSGGRAAAGGGSSCQVNNQQTSIPARVAPIAAGALIVGVLCDTAAASAGMVPGDVITSVDGQPITTPGSLTSMAAKHHPGDIVSVLWVSLDGVEHTTRMLLGQGPARSSEASSQARRRASHSAILPVSTYSSAVCAISEMPGP